MTTHGSHEGNSKDQHLLVKQARSSVKRSMRESLAKGSFYQENRDGHGSLATSGVVFAIMSTIVGGGIVSIPWAI